MKRQALTLMCSSLLCFGAATTSVYAQARGTERDANRNARAQVTAGSTDQDQATVRAMVREHDIKLSDLIAAAEKRTNGTAIAAGLTFANVNEMDEDGAMRQPGADRPARGAAAGAQAGERTLVAEVLCAVGESDTQLVTVNAMNSEVIRVRDGREWRGQRAWSAGDTDGRGTQWESAGATQVGYLKGTTIIGAKVENMQREDLGKIVDLVFDSTSGRIRYAVLSFGGWLGMGDKLFAVPWNSLQTSPRASDIYVLNVDKARLENAPGFDNADWPSMADQEWGRGVHEYYGERPYWEGEREVRGTNPAVALVRADDMIGADVETSDDDDLGDVVDLAIDGRNGRVMFAVVGVGGFLRMGETDIAIPLRALSKQIDEDDYTLNADESRIKDAPRVTKDTWATMDDREWGESVYRYYNIEPDWDEQRPVRPARTAPNPR